MADPPRRTDSESVVARIDGEPVRSGFLIEKYEDSDEQFHARYRTGSYDLDVKIEFDIGRGQIRVSEAEGYDE